MGKEPAMDEASEQLSVQFEPGELRDLLPLDEGVEPSVFWHSTVGEIFGDVEGTTGVKRSVNGQEYRAVQFPGQSVELSSRATEILFNHEGIGMFVSAMRQTSGLESRELWGFGSVRDLLIGYGVLPFQTDDNDRYGPNPTFPGGIKDDIDGIVCATPGEFDDLEATIRGIAEETSDWKVERFSSGELDFISLYREDDEGNRTDVVEVSRGFNSDPPESKREELEMLSERLGSTSTELEQVTIGFTSWNGTNKARIFNPFGRVEFPMRVSKINHDSPVTKAVEEYQRAAEDPNGVVTADSSAVAWATTRGAIVMKKKVYRIGFETPEERAELLEGVYRYLLRTDEADFPTHTQDGRRIITVAYLDEPESGAWYTWYAALGVGRVLIRPEIYTKNLRNEQRSDLPTIEFTTFAMPFVLGNGFLLFPGMRDKYQGVEFLSVDFSDRDLYQEMGMEFDDEGVLVNGDIDRLKAFHRFQIFNSITQYNLSSIDDINKYLALMKFAAYAADRFISDTHPGSENGFYEPGGAEGNVRWIEVDDLKGETRYGLPGPAPITAMPGFGMGFDAEEVHRLFTDLKRVFDESIVDVSDGVVDWENDYMGNRVTVTDQSGRSLQILSEKAIRKFQNDLIHKRVLQPIYPSVN